MMKCYDCMLEGRETEAEGICIVCGKGLCKNHMKEMMVPIKTEYPIPSLMKIDLPKVLCAECVKSILMESGD